MIYICLIYIPQLLVESIVLVASYIITNNLPNHVAYPRLLYLQLFNIEKEAHILTDDSIKEQFWSFKLLNLSDPVFNDFENSALVEKAYNTFFSFLT